MTEESLDWTEDRLSPFFLDAQTTYLLNIFFTLAKYRRHMGRNISSESVYVRALNGCYNIPTEHSESFPWSLSFKQTSQICGKTWKLGNYYSTPRKGLMPAVHIIIEVHGTKKWWAKLEPNLEHKIGELYVLALLLSTFNWKYPFELHKRSFTLHGKVKYLCGMGWYCRDIGCNQQCHLSY